MVIPMINRIIPIKRPLITNIKGIFVAGISPLITKMVNTTLAISTKNFPKFSF